MSNLEKQTAQADLPIEVGGKIFIPVNGQYICREDCSDAEITDVMRTVMEETNTRPVLLHVLTSGETFATTVEYLDK